MRSDLRLANDWAGACHEPRDVARAAVALARRLERDLSPARLSRLLAAVDLGADQLHPLLVVTLRLLVLERSTEAAVTDDHARDDRRRT